MFYLSRQRYRSQSFQYYGQYSKIFWKKEQLNLVETDMYPDPGKMMPIRSDPDTAKTLDKKIVSHTVRYSLIFLNKLLGSVTNKMHLFPVDRPRIRRQNFPENTPLAS